MNKLLAYLFSTIVIFLSSTSYATTRFLSDAKIEKITSFASVRPANGTTNDTLEIKLSSGEWGGNCHPTVAYIEKEDSHLISMLYAGWLAGKQLSIEVDDTMQGSDNKCRVTYITMS